MFFEWKVDVITSKSEKNTFSYTGHNGLWQ